MSNWAAFITKTDVDDSVIRAITTPRQQEMNKGAIYSDYDDHIFMSCPNIATRIANDAGIAFSGIGYFPAIDTDRQALPVVLPLLKAALIICILLVRLLATYVKAFITGHFRLFALYFVEFWFGLARWLDSTILDALFGREGERIVSCGVSCHVLCHISHYRAGRDGLKLFSSISTMNGCQSCDKGA